MKGARRIAHRAEFNYLVRILPNVWVHPYNVTHITRKERWSDNDRITVYLRDDKKVIVDQEQYPDEFEWLTDHLEEF